MILFKILWVINAIAAAIVLYFFFIGLADGTVSSRNIGLWLMILGALAAIMLGSIWFRSHQHPALAVTTLCVLALPALCYGLFFLVIILSGTKWN